MAERDPSKGPAPDGDEAVARERKSRDLHRLETGSEEDFPAGYRVAGLDTPTRPDPGAPPASVAQRGATGHLWPSEVRPVDARVPVGLVPYANGAGPGRTGY